MKTAEEVADSIIALTDLFIDSRRTDELWKMFRKDIVSTLTAYSDERVKEAFELGRTDADRREHAQFLIEKARAEAFEEAVRCADDQEKVHHKYADSYEEGMRDMADLLGQGIRAMKAKS